MRSPLRNPIFLPIAGLLILAVVLFTAMSALHAAEVSRMQTRQHMQSVAEALGGASYPLTDDDIINDRAHVIRNILSAASNTPS